MARKTALILAALVAAGILVSWPSRPPERTQETSQKGAPIDGSQDVPFTPREASGDPDELSKPAPAPSTLEGYRPLEFGVLSDFDASDEQPEVPRKILDLDRTRVAVSGFMMPMRLDEEGITDFVLVKNQLLCCYGQSPALNEWIYVTMDHPVPVTMDVPITVAGVLEVGADKHEEQILSLYRMAGQEMVVME